MPDPFISEPAILTRAGEIDRGELYGLQLSGVVAFRLPELSGDGIVCAEYDCLLGYNDLMATAIQMTREAVDTYQANEAEGEPILCISCLNAIDSHARRNA
jgi:hypothetical protein